MTAIIDYIKARAGEPSTYVGVATVLATLGVSQFADPAFVGHFAAVGMGLFGIYKIITADKD